MTVCKITCVTVILLYSKIAHNAAVKSFSQLTALAHDTVVTLVHGF